MVQPRENRVHMYLSDAEMKAIDDWRFANRVATRSDAIRRLCQMALVLDSKLTPIFQALKSFGADFSEVQSSLAKSLDPDQESILIPENLFARSSRASVNYMRLLYTLRDLTGRAYEFKGAQPIDDMIARADDIAKFFEGVLADTEEMTRQIERIGEAINERGTRSDQPEASSDSPRWDWVSSQADAPPPTPKPTSTAAKRQKR